MGSEYATATTWVAGRTKKDPAKPTMIHITQKGHNLMGEVMRRNALAGIARGEGDWYPEPPFTRLREPNTKGTP